MIALAAYRADMHSCGHPLSETTTAEAEGKYAVGPPHRCWACDALAIRQDEYAKNPATVRPQAQVWRAERR